MIVKIMKDKRREAMMVGGGREGGEGALKLYPNKISLISALFSEQQSQATSIDCH